MENKPTPLADQLAGLRAASAANDDSGWLPAALDALITACLMRIFARLEQILLLWKSGHLPLPAIPRPSQRPAPLLNRQPAELRAQRESGPFASRRPPHPFAPPAGSAAPPQDSRAPRSGLPRSLPAGRTLTSPACIHAAGRTVQNAYPARAPPPNRRKSRPAGLRKCDLFISISK